MNAIDIEKVVKVLKRSVPGHCNCWKCTEAKEAIELVENSLRAPRKENARAKTS